MTSSVTSAGSSISPTREETRTGVAVDEAEPRGVVGVHVRGAARRAR